MKPTRILTVVGARPQFVKAAVVSKAMSRFSELSETIVHTGQHYDANMSSLFFEELDIPAPSHHLAIGGNSHGANTGRMIEATERIMQEARPDLVLVYGDTDSTLAGALAAAKLDIPVAHVEAGLRSFNRQMPEEINRVLTDHLSTLLFVPSQSAATQLAREGIDRGVVDVGDVMHDAVNAFAPIAQASSTIINRLGVQPKAYVLATVHRKENTDDPVRLAAIFAGLGRSSMPIVLPLHPRTKSRMTSMGVNPPANAMLVDPLGYFDMMALEASAHVIATDSGGVQKEAYFHGVPCITMRDETEWTELVDAGANELTGADADKIGAALASVAAIPRGAGGIYGCGDASQKIAHEIASGNWK